MEERCELLKQMGTEDVGSIAEAARSSSSLKNIHNISDSTMTWSPTHNSNRNNPESKVLIIPYYASTLIPLVEGIGLQKVSPKNAFLEKRHSD